MDIIPATSSKGLTKDTTSANHLNCGYLLKYYKILRNGKYHPWGSHGQTRYALAKIWKIRWIWMVGYGDN